jgi:predicted HTH domain antitoxin
VKVLEIPVSDDLDLAIGASAEELTRMARTVFAVRLFELGKITSGRAAELAGMPRRQFLLETAQHGIPSVAWDDEELAAEGRAEIRKAES